VLLEYFTTGVIESKNDRVVVTKRPIGFPEDKTIICVITQNDIIFYDAGISPNLIYPSDLEGAVEKYFLENTILSRLYQLLIQPIKPWLKDKQRIYIIPHGPLHYVPFQALTATDPDLWLHPDAPQFIYTPSATILFRDSPSPEMVNVVPNDESSHLSCLAIGYNGSSDSSQAEENNYAKYEPLQMGFAEIEAKAVAQLTDGDAVTGLQSKKQIIEQSSYRWLHISCHGNFDPVSPLQSALYLGPDEKLTAREVLEPLNLSCDLAVLSASESGLSLVQRGDELLGFYRYIQEGQRFADALQQAQHDLRNMRCSEVIQALERFKKIFQQGNDLQEISRIDSYIRRFDNTDPNKQVFSDPYYWAAFILMVQRLS